MILGQNKQTGKLSNIEKIWSSLSKEEQDAYNLLGKYREALSQRDEIDTSPNSEVDLLDKDKLPFSLSHFMWKKKTSQYW